MEEQFLIFLVKSISSDKSLLNSPLANILPTKPESFSVEPFRPTLTELGKRHPLLIHYNNL